MYMKLHNTCVEYEMQYLIIIVNCWSLSVLSQAQHAEESGAAAVGVMPTTFFKPSSIGVYTSASESVLILSL